MSSFIPYYLAEQMLAKIIGNELGNREGKSVLTKMTTLLYYLIHSLLSFLAGVSKDNRE